MHVRQESLRLSGRPPPVLPRERRHAHAVATQERPRLAGRSPELADFLHGRHRTPVPPRHDPVSPLRRATPSGRAHQPSRGDDSTEGRPCPREPSAGVHTHRVSGETAPSDGRPGRRDDSTTESPEVDGRRPDRGHHGRPYLRPAATGPSGACERTPDEGLITPPPLPSADCLAVRRNERRSSLGPGAFHPTRRSLVSRLRSPACCSRPGSSPRAVPREALYDRCNAIAPGDPPRRYRASDGRQPPFPVDHAPVRAGFHRKPGVCVRGKT
jgi:hypothetical protein